MGFDDEQAWDEHRWEQFIRRQDAKADEYVAMLEYYGDEPGSHNLIARSMGWDHLLTACGDEPDPQRCAVCPDTRRGGCQCHQTHIRERAALADEGDEPEQRDATDVEDDLAQQAVEAEWNIRYAQHAVRELATDLVLGLDDLCTESPGAPSRPHDPFTHVGHHVARCAGKIAAALAGYTEPNTLGLTIAYLKISYHAACAALGQIGPARSAGQLTEAAGVALTDRLTEIRRHLANLIAEFRMQLARVMD